MNFKHQLALLSLTICLVFIGAIQSASIAINVKYSTVLATLPQYYHGVNYVGFWDEVQGSVGSENALRRAGVQLIRFPGGIPGDWYNWQNPGPNSMTTPKMLYDYATRIGAKVLFQTNAHADGGSPNTAAHAANWVQYCKDNAMDVPYWEIGNEPEWWTGAIQPGQYYDIFNAQAPAMKAKNANIKIMGCATSNAYFNQVLMQKCAANVNALSFHWYGGGGYTITRESAQTEWPTIGQYMRSLRNPPMPLYITEWSPLGAGLGDVSNDYNKQIGAAICYADIIGMFTKIGVTGYTMFGCIHGVQDNWGILTGNVNDYKPQDEPNPTYFVLPIWTKMGPSVLGLNCAADTNKVLSAYANKKSDNSVQVMVINKAAACSVNVAFTGYNPLNSPVQIYELRPYTVGSVTSMDIVYNSVTNPKPATAELPAPGSATCTGTSFKRAIPAYSISMLNFTGGVPSGALVNRPLRKPQANIAQIGGKACISITNWFDKSEPVVTIHDLAGHRIAHLSKLDDGRYYWKASPGTYIVRVSTASRMVASSRMICR